MEHSTAIMEDAGNALEGAAASSAPDFKPSSNSDESFQENNFDRRKRKRDFSESSMQHGGRGFKRQREDSPRNDKRRQRGDMGRKAYLYVITAKLSNDVLFS
jgi:hypothetical protein